MTLNNDEDLQGMQAIGRICGNVLHAMGAAIRPGMTTAELDHIGRKLLEDAGALLAQAPNACHANRHQAGTVSASISRTIGATFVP